MAVAALAEDPLIFAERFAILEPRDFGLGRGVNDADDLRLVVLARVDEGLLLFDPRCV